jgi:multicomponent K+:H+ antiporter subunit E
MCLLGMWLLLNQTISAGHVLLGIILSIAGGWMLVAVQSPRGRVRNPGTILKLALIVLVDIVQSNIAVARIILGIRRQKPTSGFIDIPLDLRSPFGLAVLACIITATPGTLWVNFNPVSGKLMIHVLDLVEEEIWISTIKERYERLLMEIFE